MGYKNKEDHNQYHKEYYYRKKGLNYDEIRKERIEKIINKFIKSLSNYDIIVENIDCLSFYIKDLQNNNTSDSS